MTSTMSSTNWHAHRRQGMLVLFRRILPGPANAVAQPMFSLFERNP